jgi:predicted dehydrogenase
MESLRVGVVGVGAMGVNHCRNFANLPETDLVGVCDLAVEPGLAMAQRYQVAYYDRLEAMLPHVDAVSISASTPAHYHLAMTALKAGRHIFIEKPMTATLQEGHLLVRAARASQSIVQVGHIERFNPANEELRAVIADMSLIAVNMRRLSPFVQSNKDADVIFDLMIHDIDLVLDIVNQPIDSIGAHGCSVFTDAIDHAVAVLRFANGVIATLSASRVTEQKVRAFEITSQDAYVEVDLLNKGISVHRRTVPEFHSNRYAYRQESLIERIFVPSAEPLMLELQHFARCVLHNTAPLVAVDDGLRAVEIASQISDAIRYTFQSDTKPLFAVPTASPAVVETAV